MTKYPTDLDRDEERRARARLVEMADRFAEEGDLRTAEWREVFLSTWRHPYVPAYYPTLDGRPILCVDPVQRGAWLDAVYSNQTLITKVMPVPLSRALAPATGWLYTSSSTLPLLMLRMLEDLDVHDGYRVLEIGTGSGYNCALLCQRLGGEHVTSVEIDPELIDLATERLGANGYTPTLAVASGAEGYSANAPYDRILSTCSVGRIPSAWLKQVTPGAVIVTDVHGLLGGTLVRLTVDAEQVATGRFVPYWTGFMHMRRTAEAERPEAHWWSGAEQAHSITEVDPTPLMREGDVLGFLAQWHLPGVTRGHCTSENGESAIFLVAADGSEAVIETTAADGRYRVGQSGPRRLWDLVEAMHEFWQSAGRPGFNRFGLTATATEQYVWLDDPDNSHRWSLAP